MSLDGESGTTAIAEVDGSGRTGLVGVLEWLLVRLPAGAQVTSPTTASVTLMTGTTDKYLISFVRPAPAGDYALRVIDPGVAWPIDESFTSYDVVPRVASFLPTVDEVARFLRTRTKDSAGNELGTFTSATRPTDSDVVGILDQAYDDVVALLDDDIPAESYRAARSTIALRAALEIELTYWPDQVPLGRSPYPQLKVLYDEMLVRLTTSVERESMEVIDGEQPYSALRPAYNFDDVSPIGLRTVW